MASPDVLKKETEIGVLFVIILPGGSRRNGKRLLQNSSDNTEMCVGRVNWQFGITTKLGRKGGKKHKINRMVTIRRQSFR